MKGLPTVLIEALAVGTPVVSTNCTFGPSEILTGELSKYLVPVQQSEALANAVKQVLADKPNVENADILKQVQAEQVALQYLAWLTKLTYMYVNLYSERFEVVAMQSLPVTRLPIKYIISTLFF